MSVTHQFCSSKKCERSELRAKCYTTSKKHYTRVMSFPIRFPGGQTKGLVKRPEGKPLSIWRNPIMQLCPKMNGHPMASFRKQVIMKKKKNIENSNNSCGVCISFYYQSTKDDFPIKDESSLWILEYIGCHKGIPRCIFRYFKGSPHLWPLPWRSSFLHRHIWQEWYKARMNAIF